MPEDRYTYEQRGRRLARFHSRLLMLADRLLTQTGESEDARETWDVLQKLQPGRVARPSSKYARGNQPRRSRR